jgi:hypothetical protein
MFRRFSIAAHMASSCLFLGMAALLGGCAGPMPTLSGGSVLPQAVTAVSLSPDSLASGQRAILIEALARRKITQDAASPLLLTATVSMRPAEIGLRQADGQTISHAKERLPLQSCADHIIRLVLGVVDRQTGEVVGRGWAEEAHCHEDMAGAFPRLSRHAVASLADPKSTAARWYWRKD